MPAATLSARPAIVSAEQWRDRMTRIQPIRAACSSPTTHRGLAVLPTYVSQDYIREQLESGGNVAATSTFARLTMGNVPRGSALFWCGRSALQCRTPMLWQRPGL